MELATADVAGEAYLLEIFVKDSSFDLTKAVCNHGLFMMAPNHWDPASSTLQRPFRLPSGIIRARISHPHPSRPIVVSVARTTPLSSEDEQALIEQVHRMLRISDENDRIIHEFHRIHDSSRERGFGRIFRSPTLFEDMVKCILLCNCQWPRTLSMAKALCELQLQANHSCNPEGFHPKTPQKIMHKRKSRKRRRVAVKLEIKLASGGQELLETPDSMINQSTQPADTEEFHSSNPSPTEPIGYFPTPEELAVLDAEFLADRCKLGYRAKHIVSLAQSIVDGNVHLRKLEELSEGLSQSSYESIDEQLSALSGFGPFTRANVLMCMGFYDRVPTDTETLRHIRQFHGRNCDLRSVQKDIEVIYEKYAPFQFLAYWSELWGYYEEKFGTWSKMPASRYQLVTASNMKDKICKGLRVKKPGLEED